MIALCLSFFTVFLLVRADIPVPTSNGNKHVPFHLRHKATFNLSSGELSRITRSKQRIEFRNHTVISANMFFNGNSRMKIFYDLLDHGRKIRMDLDGGWYRASILSTELIDKMFEDVRNCFDNGPCSTCDQRQRGFCERIESFENNFIAEQCSDVKDEADGTRQFNGILLLKAMHIPCSEMRLLTAIDMLRPAMEWI